MSFLINPGLALQQQRKKVTKTCPVCGQEFEGYINAQACKKHAGAYRAKLFRERNKMPKINAVLIDKNFNIISGDFAVNADDDFNVIEIAAKNNATPCAIKWSRASDGQIAYWTPSGSDFNPHWYSQ